MLQVLGYMHAIWARIHRDHLRTRLLPPILPLVLHHGRQRFTGPTSLRALLDLRGVPAALVALQPDFTFLLDDLADQTEEQLQERVGSTFAQLALLSMQHLRGADPATAEAVLRGWASLTERLATAKNGQDDLLTLFSYILQIGVLPEERVDTVLNEITPRSSHAMLTTAQQIARRVNRENGPKWLKQGQAKLLLRQLEKKFGPLQKVIVARIRRADSEQLGAMGRSDPDRGEPRRHVRRIGPWRARSGGGQRVGVLSRLCSRCGLPGSHHSPRSQCCNPRRRPYPPRRRRRGLPARQTSRPTPR